MAIKSRPPAMPEGARGMIDRMAARLESAADLVKKARREVPENDHGYPQ
jgi:hypothetical protein